VSGESHVPSHPPSGRRAVGWLRHRWRRSLQLRVVATTILLGLAVVAVVGVLLLNRIQNGLVEERLNAARGEAQHGRTDAQARFDTVSGSAGLNLLVNDLLPSLASADPDRTRDVVLLRGLGNDRPAVVPNLSSRDLALSVIPLDLRRRVVQTGRQEAQFVRVRRTGSERSVPGIAVGSRVSLPVAGDYELYFVFTLEREQDTIALVRRTLVGGGGALVLLLAAISWVVTRQVVSPVRQAALVAQRLSSGRLHDRMIARGEDDLARLAASFNTMAQNLQRQIGQLENLSRVQQRFVSDVSHELRTPLTTIRMAADLIYEARDGFDAATARSAELLETQLDRFEALLDDLLEISRIDAGGDLLELEPADLRDVAARVVDAAVPLSGTSGSVLDLVPGPTACLAEMDVRRIERVLRNLVVNALEHGNGLPIEIRTGCDEDAVAVSVRDLGVGLKPGESALVFNRFWRGDPSRARTLGGTGLGLAIATEDVRLHGGWLQAWGEPGRGSCFRLTLPRRPGHELVASPLPIAPRTDEAELAVGGPYLRLPRPVSSLASSQLPGGASRPPSTGSLGAAPRLGSGRPPGASASPPPSPSSGPSTGPTPPPEPAPAGDLEPDPGPRSGPSRSVHSG
jgi:two-component system sensor histidine kinase MtrB